MTEDEDSKLICESLAPFGQEEMLAQRPFRGKRERPEPVKTAPPSPPKALWLRLDNRTQWEERRPEVVRILQEDPGPHPVKVYLEQEQKKLQMAEECNTAAGRETLARLERILGPANVVL